MNRQTQARRAGERRAQMTLLRLMCAVSVWRTLMTRVLPLTGCASWWTGLVCLLPGLIVAAIYRWGMALTHADTLSEAVRAALGRGGVMLLSVVLCVLLILDGVASITALVTIFTEGVGTRGTQWTLAILTGVVLLFSLHREGLARGAHLLRWMILAGGILLAGMLLADSRVDHLFPLFGDGRSSVLAAVRAGFSLAWPVTLLLSVEATPGQGRLRGAVLPAFGAVGALWLLLLTVPHELLARHRGLAMQLLLPTHYASNALRVIALSLLMLSFFLAIGGCAQTAVRQLCLPMKYPPAWLPYALLAALFLTQIMDTTALWRWLGMLEPWLLLPLAAMAVLTLLGAWIRRKNA